MITEHTKAVLLFTCYFSKELKGGLQPLNISEWNMLGAWMVSKNLKPENFLSQPALLDEWTSASIPKSRLYSLLERRSSLAIALEKWVKAGVWVLSRGEEGYPQRIREKLKNAAPPVLFGVGDQQLLNLEAVGMVGSRDTSETESSVASDFGARVAGEKYAVVSGGASGIDEASVKGALDAGGTAVIILPDSLLKRSLVMMFRKAILAGRLVLISPFNPEAAFSAGNAMFRNRLIYTFSAMTIVIRSGLKGGTWTGANENLSRGWCPLFIAGIDGPGNLALLKAGASLLPAVFSVEEMLKHLQPLKSKTDLFS